MKVLALALTLIASATAVQAMPAAGWTVDKNGSAIRFSTSVSGAAFSGAFSRWDADIHFDPANLAGSSATVTVDVASAATGDADRDQALPTASFFSAAKFPRATFSAHAFKSLGGNRFQALGQLTLRGVTRPVVLPFTLAIANGRARMNAQVVLDRLVFGVGQDEWRATTSLPAQVKVDISLTALRR
jgi:polyisoprenoid-binding protein YceI